MDIKLTGMAQKTAFASTFWVIFRRDYRMRLSAFGLSDIGPSRSKNEDAWAALSEIGFFALADGMGGHQAGEIASQEAI